VIRDKRESQVTHCGSRCQGFSLVFDRSIVIPMYHIGKIPSGTDVLADQRNRDQWFGRVLKCASLFMLNEKYGFTIKGFEAS